MAKKKYRVRLQENYCKKCGICMHFCPSHILELKGVRLVVEKEEECIGCGACEIRCPDFAITVEEKD
jgi:2-oxoglutarate ferredoxin oxidoreductase subunit delta